MSEAIRATRSEQPFLPILAWIKANPWQTSFL
jgi:hypothetical protein